MTQTARETVLRGLALAATVLVATTMLTAARMAPAAAVDVPAGEVVSDDPAGGTPHVVDGRVLSVVQVGDTIVLGGRFSRARNDDSQAELSRQNLLAFDASTGRISQDFVANTDGRVDVVLPSGDGESVYVGGSFSSIGGVARSNLARVRVSDGSVMTSFDAGAISGRVKDLRLAGGRLWVAGGFTHVRGNPQRALATVDPGSGRFDGYMALPVDGTNGDGFTTVSKMDVTPDESRLVAVGNFHTVAGAVRHQMFVLDLSGTSAAVDDSYTPFYESACSPAFDSYMRDVDISPDGSFYVITTTGAYRGSESACDTSARFEISSTGTDIEPSWVDYTGGDTTYAVEITDSAVYTGGHARWQNNAYAGDRAGPGAVSRPGIAALDPVNGLPLSWNPTRTRGVGVFDFLATDQGLWVASDTDRIGRYEYHGRIALMPAAGTTYPAVYQPRLPSDVYVAGATGAASDPGVLYRVNAGGPTVAASSGIDWAADSSASPSPYHNQSSNRAAWSGTPAYDASVPAATPGALFQSELWDPGSGAEQQWEFPVAAGTTVDVRLYFANRCTCTDQPGERVFDVSLDSDVVLDDLDLAGTIGHDVATMRSFSITSDGVVDIDLGHVTENPLVSAIEIRRTDTPPPTDAGGISSRAFDGTSSGGDLPVSDGGVDWNGVRGAFMLNGSLYAGWSDGSFTRRTFDGQSYGPEVAVDTADELVPITDWREDVQQATGMFFDQGRVYFTRSGSDQLFYRYFSPESDVVGTKRLVAAGSGGGIDFSQVRGMFLADDRLYWATSDGVLHRMDWRPGPVAGSPTPGTAGQVSGPDDDGLSWSAKALFVHQCPDGTAPSQPDAAFSVSCQSRTCDFDASGSIVTGGTLESYSWDFGDGSSGTGATPSHEYVQDGTYQVRLTVTAQDGRSDSVTRDVPVERVNQEPVASFTAECVGLECTLDAAGSADPDGSLASYSWDFGDGSAGEGDVVGHAYDTPGQKTVTLTVADDEGATATATETIEVSEISADLALVGVAGETGAGRNHRVTVPGGVQPGDTMVLFFTLNSTSGEVEPPAGWSELEAHDGGNFRARAWTRTVTAQDAGSTVTVGTTNWLKADVSLAAYRGSGGSSVSVSASGVSTSPSSAHTSPTLPVAQEGSWLVTYWGEKSSGAQSWSAPAEVTERRTGSSGAGGGAVSALLGDSAGPVATGQGGGLTATTSAETGRVAAFSVVLTPHQTG